MRVKLEYTTRRFQRVAVVPEGQIWSRIGVSIHIMYTVINYSHSAIDLLSQVFRLTGAKELWTKNESVVRLKFDS